ncbi:hypothetical protein BDV93DRAFT_560715 [Ceratobasidium sp. AG-I]|nr:hypothetical protein BDV93DRAFT_560715 [Ceratobasidium sp. AG-I]
MGNLQGVTPVVAPSLPTQPDTQAHLAAFFVQYTGFQYNPAQPSVNQFNRLRRTQGWSKKDGEFTHAYRRFHRALVLQFNATYGTDQNNLASWQNLCRALKIEEIPSELSKCRKVVKKLFINLIDLIDMPNTGRPVRHFKTEVQLSKYCKRTEKIILKEDAHAGGLLKYLLRQIIFPRNRNKRKNKPQASQASSNNTKPSSSQTDTEQGVERELKRRRVASPQLEPEMNLAIKLEPNSIPKLESKPKPKAELKPKLEPVPKTEPKLVFKPKPELRRVPTLPPQPIRRVNPRSYIQAFFWNYISFDYDPSEPVMDEFRRMCAEYGWKDNDKRKKDARGGIQDALALQFNEIYGTDVNDLSAWQNLCRVLQFPSVPGDLDLCRQLVDSTFVNIVDLIDTGATGQPIRHFGSEEELSRYTKITRKFFPRNNIKAGSLLKFLLRRIFSPNTVVR